MTPTTALFTLIDTIETDDQRTRAEQPAREAKSVKIVINNLQVQKK